MAKDYVKPVFSQKYYEVIAEWIKKKTYITDYMSSVKNISITDLADLFESDNPKFNREKFIKKCME